MPCPARAASPCFVGCNLVGNQGTILKPSNKHEPKKQAPALGLLTPLTATPVHTDHPPHSTWDRCGSEPTSWALQRCHGSVPVSPCRHGIDHVGHRAQQSQAPFLGWALAAWGRVPWHLGTVTSPNLFPGSLEERQAGRRICVGISPTPAAAWVLLSRKAKIGSVQTQAAQQPLDTCCIPMPEQQKAPAGSKPIDPLPLLPVICCNKLVPTALT